MAESTIAEAGAMLRAALRPPSARTGPHELIGIEHEYRLWRGGERVDFRDLIHALPIPGMRIDPGDAHAYRCRSGMALPCDDEDAEIASPPVVLRPGFTEALGGWAAEGRRQLAEVLPDGIAATGYSTHLSVAVDDGLVDDACLLFSRCFAAAVMLMVDGPDSNGIFVRPRPGRVEICGEYVCGPRLASAAALAAGGVLACVSALTGGAGAAPLPAALDVSLQSATGRYGIYVARRIAFGFDLYASGRSVALPVTTGGCVTVQEHVEQAWAAARTALGPRAEEGELRHGEDVVRGRSPLGVEGAACGAPAGMAPARSAHGWVLDTRRRVGSSVTPMVATWGFTVLRVTNGCRCVHLCVPGPDLDRFVAIVDTGTLDPIIACALEAAPTARTLAHHSDTIEPGVWDGVVASPALLPPERDAKGRQVGAVASRQGKVVWPSEVASASASPEPTPESSHTHGRPQLLVGLVVAAVLALALAAAYVVAVRDEEAPAPEAVASTTVPPPTTAAGIASTTVPAVATTVPPTSVLTTTVPTTAPTVLPTVPVTTVTTRPATTSPATTSPATTSTSVVTDVAIGAGCQFGSTALSRPVGSTVTFRNQSGVAVTVLLNAPGSAPDVNVPIAAGQQTTYPLSVTGTYFVECNSPGASGSMQIMAS